MIAARALELPPGAWSSRREGETIPRPGRAAGFRAGVSNGHHLVNRDGVTHSGYFTAGERPMK